MIRILFFIGLLLGSAITPLAAAELPIHHDLKIILYPDRQTLSVRDTITLHRNGPVKFTLSPKIVLLEALVNGQRASPMARQNEFFVALPPTGDKHELTLVYTARLPSLEDHLNNPSQTRGFTGNQGTFLPSYSQWYPKFESEWLTYKASIKTPALHRAIVPGKLLSEATEGSVYHAIFETESPIDAIDLFAGPYEVTERLVDGVRLRTYFHRTLKGLESGYLDSTAAYLRKFSESIGPYPYSSFHIVSSPLPVGYGFPHLTYMGENVLRLPFIRHTSLGHEVLHSWWGNGVYVDYETGNWAEGLTTYMADYAFAAATSADKALEKRLSWLRDYAALPRGRDKPVASFSSKTHTASQVIGYNKVAYLFHMLRQEIGAKAFDRAIKRFWRMNRGNRAGWQEVADAFNQEGGQNLGWFFDQWLNRTGAPILSLKSVSYSAGETTITVSQTAPTYRLSVPLTLDDKSYILQITGRESTQVIKTATKPRTISIDPEFDLFRKLSPEESPAILRDVTLSSSVKVVVLSTDREFKKVGEKLGQRMVDTQAQIIDSGDSLNASDVLLIIGRPLDVSRYLQKNFLTNTPPELSGRGTARVWANKPLHEGKVAIVEADDLEALKALLRPLPHYGRKSYVVFDGAKAVEKGIWKAEHSPLIKNLD